MNLYSVCSFAFLLVIFNASLFPCAFYLKNDTCPGCGTFSACRRTVPGGYVRASGWNSFKAVGSHPPSASDPTTLDGFRHISNHTLIVPPPISQRQNFFRIDRCRFRAYNQSGFTAAVSSVEYEESCCFCVQVL